MLSLRSPVTRIKILLLGVMILGIHLLRQPSPAPPTTPDPKDYQINVADLEKELLDRTARQDVEFESPFDEQFFYGKLKASRKTRLDLKGIAKKREAMRKRLNQVQLSFTFKTIDQLIG